MAFPTNVDADPDPTTQIPWPSRNGKHVRVQSPKDRTPVGANGNGTTQPVPRKPVGKHIDPCRPRMSNMDLVKLSISMAGAQVAWTVELGYDVAHFG